MAFKDLGVEELREVAEFFAIDVETAGDKPSKRELLAAFAAGEDPLTWDDYEDSFVPNKKQEEPAGDEPVEEYVDQERVLDTVLKMERGNPRFDIRGYTFTKDHPYRPVTREDADWIVVNVEGFRLATTQEVSDYYS